MQMASRLRWRKPGASWQHWHTTQQKVDKSEWLTYLYVDIVIKKYSIHFTSVTLKEHIWNKKY